MLPPVGITREIKYTNFRARHTTTVCTSLYRWCDASLCLLATPPHIIYIMHSIDVYRIPGTRFEIGYCCTMMCVDIIHTCVCCNVYIFGCMRKPLFYLFRILSPLPSCGDTIFAVMPGRLYRLCLPNKSIATLVKRHTRVYIIHPANKQASI